MAFTYSWTTIPDSDTDPDSPVTTNLMTGINHDLIYLREWIGKDYYAGAVPNHNHDGVNSSLAVILGEGLLATHVMEVHDHFCEGAANTSIWTTGGGGPTYTINGHYAGFGSGVSLESNFSWRIDQVKVIFEARVKATPVTTTWPFGALGMAVSGGGGRQALFTTGGGADQTRCQTVGSGGTQNTDVSVGGNGIDDWHIYRVNQTSSAQTVFSIDGTVVATHATAVPDATSLVVRITGGANIPKVDYVRCWATENPVSTA